MTPASLARRLLALVYDSLLVVGMCFFIGILAVIANGGQSLEANTIGSLLLWLGLLSTPLLFYTLFCGHRRGATLGMLAWHIRVVDRQGNPIGHRRAALRMLAGLAAALPLGAGWLALLFHPQQLSWHDRWTGTQIVHTKDT